MKLVNSFATITAGIIVVAIFPSRPSHAAKTTPSHLLQMKGTATAEMRPNPIDPSQMVPCFDVPLYDLVTGEEVGMGTDCLSVAEDMESCDGLEVTATSVFDLAEGSLTIQVLTSAQPTTFGSPDATHITGAIPTAGENSVVSGDGIYENASGSVRLSGAVNMAMLESDGQATFNCLWIVYLDNPMEDGMMDEEDGSVMAVKGQAVEEEKDDMSTMDKRYVLQMAGTATAEMRPNPLDETQMLPCFDVPLIDLATGETMGMGTDCLSVVGPDDCGGLQVTATTVFQFDEANSIVATGETSVQPTTHGSPDATHITGAIPASTGEENIEGGTGDYEKATGTVRLSGAVNMADLESKGEATFDCLWVMDVMINEMEGTTSSAVRAKIGLGIIAVAVAVLV